MPDLLESFIAQTSETLDSLAEIVDAASRPWTDEGAVALVADVRDLSSSIRKGRFA